jgi:uncharacterized protein YaiI (UPF0178 family)
MLDIYIDADACPVKEEVYRAGLNPNFACSSESSSWHE